MSENLLFGIIYFFSLSGIADTFYIAYCKFKKKDICCFIFPRDWCAKVQRSSYAKIMGIHNSILGFFGYAALLLLILLFSKGIVPFFPILVLGTVMFAFSVYFIFLQAFVIRAFCIWCVFSAIGATSIFISLLLLGRFLTG